MLQVLSLIALAGSIQAQAFTDYLIGDMRMQYRVLGSTVEYNIRLFQKGKETGCANLFGLKTAKTPYTFADVDGRTYVCNNLKSPLPFGVNLKVTGVPQAELNLI